MIFSGGLRSGWAPASSLTPPQMWPDGLREQAGYKTPNAVADNDGRCQTVIMQVGRPLNP
ncbi:hypothetical protein GCM10023203_55020 [Actinomycetospora straminea]|uniref:Uncharacterized protein n=1 Tax=Actinomycetospora straminea TaxID=663607 RepID=A0ABP9F5S4_9PSEU